MISVEGLDIARRWSVTLKQAKEQNRQQLYVQYIWIHTFLSSSKIFYLIKKKLSYCFHNVSDH